MCAGADGGAVLQFAKQPLPDLPGERGVDVADGLPRRFVELDGADDGVAEQQRTPALRGDDDAEMSGGMPGGHGEGDAGGDRRVGCDGPQVVAAFGGDAKAAPDVVEHPHIGVGDEVIPVARAEPDRGTSEDRDGVDVEQPAAVVSVQMGAHHVGNVGRANPDCAQAPSGSWPPTSSRRWPSSRIAGPMPASTRIVRSPARTKKQPIGSQAKPSRMNRSSWPSGRAWSPKYAGDARKVPSAMGWMSISPISMRSLTGSTARDTKHPTTSSAHSSFCCRLAHQSLDLRGSARQDRGCVPAPEASIGAPPKLPFPFPLIADIRMSKTMQILLRWDWPGNVSELRTVLMRLTEERHGLSVRPQDLSERMAHAPSRRSLG